jgi:hypothetical protein
MKSKTLIQFTLKNCNQLFRFLFSIILIFTPAFFFSQESDFQVWSELGVKVKLHKKFEYGFDITNRYGNNGLETFFPQLSIKYKVTDWFKPSLDYRIIGKKEPNSNYLYSNRLNLNLQFNKMIERFNLGLRVRYQYSFTRLSENYQPEFDQAIRIKPSFSYDINNSFFTPAFSIEYFYNPNKGPLGKRMTKLRAFVGTELEIKGPHEVEFGYIYDQSLNLPNPSTRHILNISYCYKIDSPKNKKKKVSKGVRWL